MDEDLFTDSPRRTGVAAGHGEMLDHLDGDLTPSELKLLKTKGTWTAWTAVAEGAMSAMNVMQPNGGRKGISCRALNVPRGGGWTAQQRRSGWRRRPAG